MPAFLLDRVASSFAASFPNAPLTEARLRQHDADLALRYDGAGQLDPRLVESGLEPSDLTRSTVVLAAQLYLAGGHAMAQAMRRACALALVLQGEPLVAAWSGRRSARRAAGGKAGGKAGARSPRRRAAPFVATPCPRLDALLRRPR